MSLWILPIQAQSDPGQTPVPEDATGTRDGAERPVIRWNRVAGHGPQTGLITNATFDYSGYTETFGVDQENWNYGDPQEGRNTLSGQATAFRSSYGVDVIRCNSSSGPDAQPAIFCLDEFSIPLSPIGQDRWAERAPRLSLTKCTFSMPMPAQKTWT